MQHKCDLPSPEKGLALTQVILLFRPYQDKHEFNNIWLGEIIEFEAFFKYIDFRDILGAVHLFDFSHIHQCANKMYMFPRLF